MWEYTDIVTVWTFGSIVATDYGANGWELIQIIDWDDGKCKMYFKRQVHYIPHPRDMLGNDDNDGTGGVKAKPKEPELV